jgi:hypothetical protein
MTNIEIPTEENLLNGFWDVHNGLTVLHGKYSFAESVIVDEHGLASVEYPGVATIAVPRCVADEVAQYAAKVLIQTGAHAYTFKKEDGYWVCIRDDEASPAWTGREAELGWMLWMCRDWDSR